MSQPIPLQPGRFYHIYNRGNNHENIFIEERNYHYFMKLWGKYIDTIAQTFAYCLLRNHFHILVRLNDQELSPTKPVRSLSQPFSNFFNAYSRSINIAYQRSGALFKRPFGRVEIKNDAQLLQVVAYIHRNPQKHGFVADFRDWPYSSYQPLITNPTHQLDQIMVQQFFGGLDHFIEFHQSESDDGIWIEEI